MSTTAPACLPDLGATVADVMITGPKLLPAALSIAQARTAFEDDHVVMLLLADRRTLVGTLLRNDVPAGSSPLDPALPLARLSGRTVAPTEDAGVARERLLDEGERRLAVVDGDGRLLGLLCLTRRRDGFCSDAGVAARARARGTDAAPLPPDPSRADDSRATGGDA